MMISRPLSQWAASGVEMRDKPIDGRAYNDGDDDDDGDDGWRLEQETRAA